MNIGDRIKKYEKVSNYSLLPREPVVIRVDGKTFHSFTRKMNKPFDMKLVEAMVIAGEKTAKEMMGFKLGYHQSDEFTFLLSDLDSYETQCWFNNEIQKLASISASLFTAYFNEAMGGTTASFDGRAFNIPLEDSPNVFIWRQRDWERNSLQMFSRSFFSHNKLENKNKQDMHEMLFGIGENWADLSDVLKNGTFITKDGKRINKKMDYQKLKDLLK